MTDPATATLVTITGNATAAEVAAITAALMSISAPAQAVQQQRLWNAPSRQMRPRVSAGAGAWRASALPR
ncbi:MAG: acyl-CoA carboxylase epsilon subunit [Candidatus Nanopelagicales bacterium]